LVIPQPRVFLSTVPGPFRLFAGGTRSLYLADIETEFRSADQPPELGAGGSNPSRRPHRTTSQWGPLVVGAIAGIERIGDSSRLRGPRTSRHGNSSGDLGLPPPLPAESRLWTAPDGRLTATLTAAALDGERHWRTRGESAHRRKALPRIRFWTPGDPGGICTRVLRNQQVSGSSPLVGSSNSLADRPLGARAPGQPRVPASV